jgi:hypothetical protein
MSTPPARRHLVILRAGDKSLHPEWIQGTRHFDLLISYYGGTPDCHRQGADHYEMRKGPKWSCIADLLAARPGLIDQYDSFWFPDDDLSVSTETLNRMFALFEGLGLDLAQPALTLNSYFSWALLLQQEGYVARYSQFVEVMAPLFTRETLRRVLPTFSESRSGWGLDWVWPTVLAPHQPKIAILDATPVWHTRPIGGELYKNNPDLDPRLDERQLMARYRFESLRASAPYALQASLAYVIPSLWQRMTTALKSWNGRRVLKRRAQNAASVTLPR